MSIRTLILILSIIIGLVAGIAASVLKIFAHKIRVLIIESFTNPSDYLLYFGLPIMGVLLAVVFMNTAIREKVGAGVSSVLFSISKKKGVIKPHKMYSAVIGSALTVGFGGSVGLEAPVVSTGAAIGSNIARVFRLSHRYVILLIGCGASGAIAAIFNAPIAGVIFALEVLMLDLTTASLVPLLLASVTGTITAKLLMGESILFSFEITDKFQVGDTPFYLLLGLACGLISVYFSRMEMFIEGKLGRLKNSYVKVVLGGLLLGALIYLFPPLFGEGYASIKSLLYGQSNELLDNSRFVLWEGSTGFLLLFVFTLIFVKVIAAALTIGSGGIGGIFAPSLFVGAMTGFFFSKSVNTLQSFFHISESNFTLVGMAGLAAGVLHAPLTAMFLIAELTSGYQLIVPLMITASIAYMTSKSFDTHSIYTKKLAKKGQLLTHHKDKAVLTLMSLKDVIEKDFLRVRPNLTLGELVKMVARSKRNIFPVVNKEGQLLGIVLLDDIREIMFNADLYDEITVEQIMNAPAGLLQDTYNMEQVMAVFTETGAWNLPVVSKGKYLGFVSKSKMFSNYRKLLIQFSDD